MKTLNKRTILISTGTLLLGLLLGWLIFGKVNQQETEDHSHSAIEGAETIWTCSMHPQIRQNEPGDCPICGMDLIPLEPDENKTLDPMAISMSPTAMQLARVQTVKVGTGNTVKSIRLNGKVQADERLVYTQPSHIPGRVESLTVNFTGDFVKQGQVIAYIYSPDLVTAQEELFEARKIKETQPALFNAAKEKLKNWKITQQQIDQILESNKPMEQFPILANVSGFITKKMVNLGDYVQQGEALYEIANLSKVWVLFDVYESDMGFINNGDQVEYSIRSLPGKTFSGKISYIDPVIDPKTRVAKARVERSNDDLQLKPEMFASGIVEARRNANKEALTVPKTAVMWTGKRSVVYVMNENDQGINFMMREVQLGSELGESYEIESGLDIGEEIAVNGTFSIDAAAQLAGKPSMMNTEGGVAMTGHNHGSSQSLSNSNPTSPLKKITISDESKRALKPIFNAYFSMKTALANDNLAEAKAAGEELNHAAGKVDMNLFEGEAHSVWMQQSAALNQSTLHTEHATPRCFPPW